MIATNLSCRPEEETRDVSVEEGGEEDILYGQSWQSAARVLLSAAGYRGDVTSADSLKDLAQSLQGSGFELANVLLVNHVVPSTQDRLGCLLQIDGQGWLAVLGDNEDGVVLSEVGRVLGPCAAVPAERITDVWILNERVLSMGSLSSFLKRHKKHFIDLFMAAVVVNFFALCLPLFSSFVYDKILGNGILDTLWALVLGLGIVIGIEFCVRMLRIGVAERFALGSEIEIDHATFRNLLDTRTNKMPSIGGILEKYKQILAFRDFLSSSYILALADLPFLFLFLAAITIAAGPLVFVSVVCGLLMIAVSYSTMDLVLEYDHKSRGASERRFGLMSDVLVSREAIVGGAMRNKLAERWRQASIASVEASSKARYWRGLGMTLTNSISYISFVSVLAGGVYMVEAHSLTSGGLLAASLLTSRTMGSFASINTLLLRYREFRIALRELNQLMPSAPEKEQLKRRGRLQGAVRLDRVMCRLRSGDTPVLNGISLSINPGEIVGIAGAPGAGKTTLLRLMAGVLEPDEGRVLIDNIPVNLLAQEDISLSIGFKPQDFCLIEGTIEDNVRAGRPQMTTEMRHEVLMASGLLRVFNEGALHWMTDVGPRGQNLSGGQRQMVALARALLTRPPVLLLDEPTNGFDAALESNLCMQIEQLRGASTVLISTHSRNILKICDRIIVVGQSRILADGPRDKILV